MKDFFISGYVIICSCIFQIELPECEIQITNIVVEIKNISTSTIASNIQYKKCN